MAYGDLITNLTDIGTFEAGDVGPDSNIVISNDDNYIVRSCTVSGDDHIAIYDLGAGTQIFEGILDGITYVNDMTIVGNTGNEVLLIGGNGGTLYEITIQDIIDGNTATTSYTLNNGEGYIIQLEDNSLDYSNSSCRIGVTFEISVDMSVYDYIVNMYNPNDYSTVVNTLDYSGTDANVSGIKEVYISDADITELYASIDNPTTGEIYIEGKAGSTNSLGPVGCTADDLTNLSGINIIFDFELVYDSSSHTTTANVLFVGTDSSSSGDTTAVGVYDLTNAMFIEEKPIEPTPDIRTLGTLIDGSDEYLLFTNSQTEVMSMLNSNQPNNIITTTDFGRVIHSRNNQVIVVEELVEPYTMNQTSSALKAYEGINYTPVETGPTLDFPTEENIYFFDSNNQLITEIDVGQLSPIKDTDIYSVQIATNITTDTFESITLGTTENSVDCLLSSTENPFEAVEQLTVPFTNEDIVTVYFKLSTDEVQTVGNASLELLVVGNLAT